MKTLKILLFIVTPFLVFIFSTYLTISVLLKTQQTTICPDIRGKTVEEAKEMVRKSGLSFSILRYERRNDIPYNHVTVQKPDANINTRKGRVVYAIVSEGPEMIKTPGFIGLTLEGAQEALSEKKLTLDRIISVPHSKTGKVIAQIPAEGTEILQLSAITLIVGSEQKSYFLAPDNTGADMNEVIEELEAKQIRYKMVYVRGDQFSRHSGFDLSVAPRTIFNSSDELKVSVY